MKTLFAILVAAASGVTVAAEIPAWGAIAFDSKASALGVTRQNQNSEEAREAARNACVASGSVKRRCVVVSEWHNTCGAIAIDDTSVKGKVFFKAVSDARERIEAERAAYEGCSEQAKECKVYFSACGIIEKDEK